MANDPRVLTMSDRCRNMDFVDDFVTAFTSQKDKAELCRLLLESKVPHAPVRDLHEVVRDPVLIENGTLREVDHPEFGRIIVNNSPLRFMETEQRPYQCSPRYGQDNKDVYSELGLKADEIEEMRREGVI